MGICCLPLFDFRPFKGHNKLYQWEWHLRLFCGLSVVWEVSMVLLWQGWQLEPVSLTPLKSGQGVLAPVTQNTYISGLYLLNNMVRVYNLFDCWSSYLTCRQGGSSGIQNILYGNIIFSTYVMSLYYHFIFYFFASAFSLTHNLIQPCHRNKLTMNEGNTNILLFIIFLNFVEEFHFNFKSIKSLFWLKYNNPRAIII